MDTESNTRGNCIVILLLLTILHYSTVDSQTCVPGGTNCQNGVCTHDDTCVCDIGFFGSRCSEDVNCDNFAVGVCENGGTCAGGAFVCTCPSDTTGGNCAALIDECDSNPCQNGASCTDDGIMYKCSCALGFTGVDCESPVGTTCADGPCQNGATCVNGASGGYSCSCAAGFTGMDCQSNIDECASSPCNNGGSCADSNNFYACNCADGFEGNNCETNVDDCATGPCENGATCNDGVNAYTCTCADGFTGSRCQIVMDDDLCDPNPCNNGGTCAIVGTSVTCSCAADFVGSVCQVPVGLPFDVIVGVSVGSSILFLLIVCSICFCLCCGMGGRVCSCCGYRCCYQRNPAGLGGGGYVQNTSGVTAVYSGSPNYGNIYAQSPQKYVLAYRTRIQPVSQPANVAAVSQTPTMYYQQSYLPNSV